MTKPGYRWWTLTFAVLEIVALASLKVFPPSDPGYGGSTFAWGLVFAFPMIGLAFIMCLTSTIRVLAYHRWKMRSDKLWNTVILIVALTPAVLFTTAYIRMQAHQEELLKTYEQQILSPKRQLE